MFYINFFKNRSSKKFIPPILNNYNIKDSSMEYNKLKGLDDLSYHAEKFICDSRKFDYIDISKYYSSDRFGNELIFVNVLLSQKKGFNAGVICAFSKTGKIGNFYYDLHKSYLLVDDVFSDTLSYDISKIALSIMEHIAFKYHVKRIKGSLSVFNFKEDKFIKSFFKYGFTINNIKNKTCLL